MGITRRGIEIGISVATEQSSLRPEALNKDWLGLFQQNPVTYTQYRRTEPGGAAWMFYDQLIKLVPGYDTDPRQNYEIGDVVQKTTTGERFAQYKDMATDLADRLMDAVVAAAGRRDVHAGAGRSRPPPDRPSTRATSSPTRSSTTPPR